MLFIKSHCERRERVAKRSFFRKPATAVQGEAEAGFFRKQGEAEVSLVIHFARQLLYLTPPQASKVCEWACRLLPYPFESFISFTSELVSSLQKACGGFLLKLGFFLNSTSELSERVGITSHPTSERLHLFYPTSKREVRASRSLQAASSVFESASFSNTTRDLSERVGLKNILREIKA